MNPSLVGSQMSREATSEWLSIHEGAGYDEVFDSGHKPDDGSSYSSERETSAQSLDEEIESYDGVDKEKVVNESEGEMDGREEERDSDGDEDKGDEESYEGTLGSPGGNCPFILLNIWIVNDFLPKMSDRVLKDLRARYQIPDHILIRFPKKSEKCYLGKTTDVGMYDAMFAVGLRLPLMALHCQLADFLGLSVSQIAPNAWRIFIGAEILWGRLSGGNHQLSLDEFFYCYRSQHIVSSKGIYHFVARNKDLRLVSDMPVSNRNWKSKYFFVLGMNWVCHPEERVTMPHGFDYTWVIVKDSSLTSLAFT